MRGENRPVEPFRGFLWTEPELNLWTSLEAYLNQ
jgi:hypothetical protein